METMKGLKKYNVIVILLVLTLLLPIIISQTHLIDYDYDYFNISKHENIIDYDRFLLRINTINDSICKYSLSSGVSYNDMSDNFDINSGKIHEKSFLDLGDGLYKYYVKCYEDSIGSFDPAEMEIVMVVNNYVSAKILLSKEPPLKNGRVDLTLLTSKYVSGTPSLSYTFDGISYKDIPLFGSEKTWKGYLIIPTGIEEKVISFKFKSNDLEGRQGTVITSGNVFVVDTIKPGPVYYITSTGYNNKIVLDWYYDDEVKEFKIYRSEDPDPDYIDYYKSVSGTELIDNLVEKGETYYYRISPVDLADNEGDLSKEIFSTVLISEEVEIVDTGLRLEYHSYVDNFLVEIDSVIEETNNIKSLIVSKSEKEKTLFNKLGLEGELDSSLNEFVNLRKDSEKYKLQDLSIDELNNKLDSGRLRLNIIRRKVPENLVIIDEDSINPEISEEKINNVLVNIKPDIDEREKQKSIKTALKVIEDMKVNVITNYYIIDVSYLDSSKKEFTFIDREVNSQLEFSDNLSYIEIIPKEVVESASDIIFKSGDFDVLEDDPVISYTPDVKKISYLLDRKVSMNNLRKIQFVLIYEQSEDDADSSGFGITGYFFNISENKNYLGIIIGIVFIFGLLFYFLYSKNNKHSEGFNNIVLKLEKIIGFLEKEEVNKSENLYKEISKDYKFLDDKERKKIFKKISIIPDKIIFIKLKKGLNNLEVSPNKESFKILEKLYGKLSDKSKKKIKPIFDKIKKEID
ncbi:hypothetical protein GOV12_04725 [Candidatus Pacearchaeota archaeon]|nr:hypothetical protein [Candidatus Pacearchaeota archaeon]